MGTFDTYDSGPNQIKNEGQTIELVFNKTSPTTGRLSWNIASPVRGCAAEHQAYNGVIISVDSTQVNPQKHPIDGTVYISDNTIDKDLHSGDSIDTALVIGAFYNDKETVFLDVIGLSENEPYYFSLFAVDKQNRYHTQGVHSYSVDIKSSNASSDTPGCQSVQINSVDINPNDATDLST